MTDTGVISTKNMTPNAIGLTTRPSKSPNANHALFKGLRNRGALAARTNNEVAATAQALGTSGVQDTKTPYVATALKITANVNPNFRSEGR